MISLCTKRNDSQLLSLIPNSCNCRAVASNRQTEALASVRILDFFFFFFLGSCKRLCIKSERTYVKDVFFLILPRCRFLSGYGVGKRVRHFTLEENVSSETSFVFVQ